jgi:hypothetical protein
MQDVEDKRFFVDARKQDFAQGKKTPSGTVRFGIDAKAAVVAATGVTDMFCGRSVGRAFRYWNLGHQ